MNLKFIEFLPEFLLFFVALSLLFSNLNKSSSVGDRGPFLFSFLSKLSYHAFLFLELGLLVFLWVSCDSSKSLSCEEFTSDKLAIASKFVIFILGVPWLGFGTKGIFRFFQRENMRSFEYPSLLLFSMMGSFLLVSSVHLMPFFIALNLQILPVLIALFLYEDRTISTIWATRYFILEGVCLSLFVFGAALFYGVCGDLSMKSIALFCREMFQEGRGDLRAITGFFMILIVCLIRLGAFPFHFWMKGFYKSTSNLVVPFMLTLHFSIFIGLLRLLFQGFETLDTIWRPVLFYVGFSSCLWGAISALFQKNIRSFFSCNYMFHLGMAFLGVSSGVLEGIQPSLLYWTVYTLSAGTFFFFWSNLSTNDQMLDNVSQAKGLGVTSPAFTFLITLTLLSLASIPPFAGFWCKLYILKTLIPNGWIYVSILLISSIVASFQYVHIIRTIYFSDKETEIRVAYEWKTVWTFVPIMLVIFFLFQDRICDFIKDALRGL